MLLRVSIEPPWSEPPATPPPFSCSPPPRSTAKSIWFDLPEERIVAQRIGPRVRQRVLETAPRNLDPIEAGLHAHEVALNACYRWARHATPALEANVTVEACFDQWGALDRARAIAERPEAEPLARCVEDVLGDLSFPLFVPRTTEARLTLAFRCSGLGLPPALARPSPRHRSPSSSGQCVGTPVDRVEALTPFHVDDFDEAQSAVEEEARRREELRAWRRAGKPGLPPHRASLPRVRVGLATVRWHADRESIAQHLRANLGGLQACAADAVDRGAELPERITLDINADRSGLVSAVTATPADSALDACLRREVAAVVFPSTMSDVHVRWPLLIARAPVEEPLPERAAPIEIARIAADALARGDGDAAVRHFSALVAQRPDDRMACGWQLDRLRALALVTPFGDARTETAIALLGGWLKAHPAWAADCLARTYEVVGTFATQPHREAQRSPTVRRALYETAIYRYRKILDALPSLPEAPTLRFYQAEALYSLSLLETLEARVCETVPLYERVAADPASPARQRKESAEAVPIARRRCIQFDPAPK